MILEGKTVLVAGVGTGLGREVAEAALRDGANLLLAARTASTLEEAAKALDASGKRVAWRRTDISDASDCEALVAHGVERFGALDALVQVAAYEQSFGGLHDGDLDGWRRCYETNVLGTLTLLRAAHPALKRAGGGSIVLIGSQSMFKPSLPQPGYAASKGALLTAMYYLAQELGRDNVRVNMVVPSWMWGPPVEMFLSGRAKSEGRSTEEVVAEVTKDFALGRMTEDGEVAEAAVFFCSDRARAITGQHLMVNCGELMR